jgi:hypothetical protein
MTDPTPTDWRALCAELVDDLQWCKLELWVALGEVEPTEESHALIDRALAALAQPEPQGPTDAEMQDLALHCVKGNKSVEWVIQEALVRWGRPAIEPVPVAERLPGPEDCDDQGRCWMCGKVDGDWRLISIDNPGVPQLKYAFSHWLPHWALPVPQQELDND